jgi:hypothetical protein
VAPNKLLVWMGRAGKRDRSRRDDVGTHALH